jgi:hypothetical protein
MSPFADPRTLSDEDLLHAVVRPGAQLRLSAGLRLSKVPPARDLWDAPIALRFDTQVCVLFMGALDAFDSVAGTLQTRASQQAPSSLRFQIETLATLRWLTEPRDTTERQTRSFALACRTIAAWAKLQMEDAGKNPDALAQVRQLRDWGRRLKDLASDNGIRVGHGLDRRRLLTKYGPGAFGYPVFSMLSEMGSHPSLVGLTFFALEPNNPEIAYTFGGAHMHRAFWAGQAFVQLWQTCEVVALALGWDEWLAGEPESFRNAIAPLLAETVRRRSPDPS